MTIRLLAATAAVSVAAVLSNGASALAQTGGGSGGGRTRAVDARADVFGGWDMDLTELPGGIEVPEGTLLNVGGGLVGMNAGLAASLETRHVVFGAGGDVSSRWYSGYDSAIMPGYSGTFSVSSLPGRRVTWSGSGRLSYAPVSTLPFFSPGAPIVQTPVVDYQLSDSKQFVSESLATLGFQLSRRGQLSFTAGYGVLDDPRALDAGKIHRWNIGAGYSNQVSRYGTLVFGYGYSEGGSPEQALTDPVVPILTGPSGLHSINTGYSYRRPLSFSRRTTIATRVGSTVVDMGQRGLEYRVVGDAGLTHQIGRTWSIQGTYNRDVKFVDTFVEPFYYDGITVQLAGRLTSQASLAIVSNGTRGSVGVVTVPSAERANDVSTYSFSGQFRYGLNSNVALMAEYFWFRSELGPLLNLPSAFGTDIERQGIRVGLSFGTTVLGVRR